MKTAMTEWFDELKANYPYMANEIFDKGFNKYLEKEKGQIKDAYNDGYFGDAYKYKDWEEYYNETYKQQTNNV